MLLAWLVLGPLCAIAQHEHLMLFIYFKISEATEMPWLQGLIWLVGEVEWDTQHFFPFLRKTQMSKKRRKKLKRIKRFIWVNGPQWIFPQKGGKNKQVDISVWTEARRQEILCNVTMST